MHGSFIGMASRLREARAALESRVREGVARIDSLSGELDLVYSNLMHLEHLSAMGTLSAQMVREIRTPLNAMALNLQLLERGVASRDGAGENTVDLVGEMGREVERIVDVLNQFMARVRRPSAEPEPEPVGPVVESTTDFWDEVQATDTADGFNANMSEFQMDWTTNVASHAFRTKEYFASDADGVCEACHIGYYRPAKNAYYWTNEAAGEWARVKATNVKRHPQATELAISGNASLSITGGANVVHGQFACADCHGTASGASGNVHDLPGSPYVWSSDGDIQCTDCHASYAHANAAVAAHIAGSLGAGTKVACIGCHTFGLARDFEFASSGSSDSHEVFIDPVTGEVRPVVWKNGHAIAWYSHNWQTLLPGSGRTDPAGDCAKRCHYEGNLVGAGS